MGLRYILGKSGTGKTTLCFDEIIEKNKDNSDNALIYIVPEQFTLQSEKSILEKSANGAIMRVHVLSFKRLAYYIFSQTGLKAGKILEDTGKFVLLRKIISDLKNEFKYYEKPNVTRGFIEKIAEAITEFYEYDVTIPELIENAGNDEKLVLKIQDMGLIYNRYLEYLGDHYISTDETLDILSLKIEESNFIKDAEIWIDGFSSFTPQELNVIKSLFQQAKQVNIALTSNTPYINCTNVKRGDVFYETKDTIIKINNIAAHLGIKTERVKYLKLPYRFLKSAELYYLEENYFNYSAESYDEPNRRIKVYPAKNRYDEVKFTVDYIIHMVRENNYRYSDFAIITSDISAYEDIIRPLFSLYDIPCFIDSSSDLLSNPVTEFIRSLTEIYVKNWSYESIFRFLRTGMTDISQEDLDILENYVIAYGIKGYKWGLEQWLYGFSSDKSLYSSEHINGLKNKIMEMLSVFHEGVNFKEKLTVREYAKRIYRFLDHIQVKEKINYLYEEALEHHDEVMAKQHLQIWDRIKALFEKLVEIMGDVEMDIADFSAVLEAGFYSQSMGNLPAVQDQVIIGDLVRSRIHNIKALFIMGANEGVFPGVRKETGIFTDDERKVINENGLEIAPDSISRTFQDNFIIYSAITKAESVLTVTYSQSELNGKALFPSAMVQRIHKLFTDAEIRDPEAVSISTPKALFEKALYMFGTEPKLNKGMSYSEREIALCRWFLEHYQFEIGNYLKSEDSIRERLLPETLEELYGENINTSISRLEKYITCPFAFFVQYNLEAKERQSYQVKRVDLGNLFHYILEEFSELIFRDNVLWTDLEEEHIAFYTEKAFTIVKDKIESDLFISDERNQYILVRVKRIAQRSIWALCQHIKKGSFIPYGAEIDFGIKSPVTGIVIEIDDSHKFTLTGRIDRIDIMDAEGQTYVKIIDYKSGNRKFDITDIYYGMQLQLLLYMKSIIENGKNILKGDYDLLPGGILYFKVDDPIVQAENVSSKEQLEKLVLEKFKMSGLILADEAVIKGMDKDLDKSSSVIPVSLLAKGGISKSRSSVAEMELFNDTMNYAMDKVVETGNRIIQGEIEPKPFKKGEVTGCSYCNYNSICGFDTLTKDYSKYNVFRKKNSLSVFSSENKAEGKS